MSEPNRPQGPRKKLRRAKKRLAARLKAHAETIRTIRPGFNPASYRAPGSMKT